MAPTRPLRVDGATRLVLILGDPVAQARSPGVLSEALSAAGRNVLVVPAHVPAGGFDAAIAGLAALRNLDGLILTVPHKPAGLAHCQRVTPAARAIGGVNVLRPVPGGWAGDQCDGAGFVAGLRDAGFAPEGRSVLLVGAGGAGSAIAMALVEAAAERIILHDARPERAAALAARVGGRMQNRVLALPAGVVPDPAGVDLVVNATPLGLAAGDPLPLDPAALDPAQTVADVVPSPEITPLLAAARARGCRIVTGVDMFRGVGAAILRFLYDPPPEGAGAAPDRHGAPAIATTP